MQLDPNSIGVSSQKACFLKIGLYLTVVYKYRKLERLLFLKL